MLYLGIDWSKDHHNLCILNEAGAVLSQLAIKHSVDGFSQLDLQRQRLGVRAAECLVAVETSYSILVDFLLDQGYSVYLIPPQATKGYRNRRQLSGAHTDDTDAALLASIIRTDRDSHCLLRPNSPLTQHIVAQVRLIELLRRGIHRHSCQLEAILMRTFPQAVGLFGKLTTQISLQFLSRYPTAEEAQALSRSEFEAFCREHRYSRPALISRRYAQLKASAPEANPAAIEAYRDQVQILSTLLLPQVRQRAAAESLLQKLFVQHPDAYLFDSLPGAGPLLAPSLLAKFGDHRDRFPTPARVQATAGTCPVTQQSGRRRVVHFRYSCDKEFRRITQQFAKASVVRSGWAYAYWRQVRPHVGSDSDAYRRLANRWLAIIWKMWQDSKPYDESYHLNQRTKRSLPRQQVS